MKTTGPCSFGTEMLKAAPVRCHEEFILFSIRHESDPTPVPIRFGLAPMEGVTDIAVRLWFALTCPPDFVWTPFLRVTDTYPAGKIPNVFIPEQTVLRGALPFSVIPQLMGSRAEDFSRVAATLLDDVPFVDLNCGCPSPTVVGSRAGSSLLERVDLFHSFVDSVVRACGPRRVSVKMRTGYHDASEFEVLVDSIRGLPLAQLAVHGRTRPQRYTGQSDWEKVRCASERTTVPVVGSGDIVQRSSLQEFLTRAPKIRTVIAGRGALRNPWIFSSITHVPLLEPLIVFGLLQHLGLYVPDKLLSWAANGHASVAAGNDLDRWNRAIAQLQQVSGLSGKNGAVDIDPRAFARVKMLWNYFRSSLPDAFMEPTIMRAKSLPLFLEHLTAICLSSDLDAKVIPLRYRPDLDWLYGGQGKQAPTPVS